MITMEPRRSKIPIKTTDTLAIVPLQIKNRGKRKYKLKTALKQNPEGLKSLCSDHEFLLNAKKDTLIEFRFKPSKDWSKVNSSVLDFKLTNSKSGEEIKKCKVTAFQMGHIKKYYFPDFMMNNIHEFGMGIQSAGGNEKQIEFTGSGKRPLHNGLVNYQINAFYFSSTNDFNVVNSYIHFSNSKKSLTMGSINKNDEVSLSGRGFLYESEKDSLAVYLGYVNGAYELLEKSMATDSPTGNSFVGGFQKPIPKLGLIEGSGMLRFQQSANTGLAWMTHTLIKKRNKFRTRIGLSGIQDKGNAIGTVPVQTGGSINMEYEKDAKNWNIQSNYLIASKGYAGDVSGNLIAYNKFNFTGWNKLNWSVSTRLLQTKNFTKINGQSFTRTGRIFIYKFQVEPKKIGYWQFILAPYQMFDRRNFVDYSYKNTFYNSRSSRIKTIISRKKGNLSLSTKSDLGYFVYGKSGGDQNRFFSYRIDLNLSTKTLGINAGYNLGSNRLSNALSFELLGITNYQFFLNARWGKWFFDRVLKINISNQLGYNSIRQAWINSSSLKTKISFPKGFQLSAEMVGFKNSNFFDLFWNIRATKKIGKYYPPGGTKKLKIYLFEDDNNNGKKDKAEKYLSGIFIEIDEIPLVTGNGGWIEYKAIPIRKYHVKIIDPSGNLSGESRQIMVQRNTEIFIPLYKTVALSGKVTEIKQRFKSTKFDLLGIPIIAKNIQEEIFTTYTKPDGTFSINLPPNEYTVFIDTKAFGKNFEFPENFKKVMLQQDKPQEVALSVKVKSRKMTIQKF